MSPIFFYNLIRRTNHATFIINLRLCEWVGAKHEWLLSKQFYYYAMEHTFYLKKIVKNKIINEIIQNIETFYFLRLIIVVLHQKKFMTSKICCSIE